MIALGFADDEETLARALAGWEAQMGRSDGLRCVRERLYEAAGGTTINLA